MAKRFRTESFTDKQGKNRKAIVPYFEEKDKGFAKAFVGNIGKLLNGNEGGNVPMASVSKTLVWLFKLLNMMDWDNHIRLTQEEIAENLGVNLTTGKKFIGTLVGLGLIMSVRPGDYMVNPEAFSSVGKDERTYAINEWERHKARKRSQEAEVVVQCG